MRWAFVYPPFEDRRSRAAYYVAPPLGLVSLATHLKDGNLHEVSILDFVLAIKRQDLLPGPSMYAECAEAVLATNPDIVAFGTQCSTGPPTIQIARELKARQPEVKILLGGHDVSFLAPSYLSTFDEIDFILTGEADHAIVRFGEALAGTIPYSEVPGLAWRDETGIHTTPMPKPRQLDTLQLPDYSTCAPMEEYFSFSERPTILIDSGRGCAFECEFCQTTLLGGRKVRYASIQRIIGQLRDYRDRYGEFEAYFVHDLFTARRAFVEEFCRELIRENLGITWQCRCRIDEVDLPLLTLMASAGCRMLLYGVESGSPKMLETLQKGVRRRKISTIERVQWTIDCGIFPSLSMVIGNPDETEEDLDATLTLANELVLLGSVNAFIQLSSPLAGTLLEARVRDRTVYAGTDAPNAFSQGIEFMNGKKLPADEEIIQAHPEIFTSFYSIIPAHGDLGLCSAIANSYCKLLETYGRTFHAIATSGKGHLATFRTFSDYATTRGIDLVHANDETIWTTFDDFLQTLAPLSEGIASLAYIDRAVASISIEKPVLNDKAFSKHHSTAEPWTLHRAAKVVPSPKLDHWLGTSSHHLAHSEAIIYATKDRISLFELTDRESALLRALDQANGLSLSDQSPGAYTALLEGLERLRQEGLLVAGVS